MGIRRYCGVNLWEQRSRTECWSRSFKDVSMCTEKNARPSFLSKRLEFLWRTP
jgi:hypothetical protein